MTSDTSVRLRAVTFLAPAIPLRFFELLAEHLASTLGCTVTLASDSRSSGPMDGDVDPFATDMADIGFLCSPSYLYLRSLTPPSVDLVPAGFVFRDLRHNGAEPVYFSDVVVRRDHPAQSFEDLRGTVWGYNDECSLSGYFATIQKLHELGCNGSFFARHTRTGSHLTSIEATLGGSIDAAAIDSTTLALARREQPNLTDRLRVVASWGPFPIQPVVIRSSLTARWASRIADALLRLDTSPTILTELATFGLQRCVPIDDQAYANERRALCDIGELREPPQ